MANKKKMASRMRCSVVVLGDSRAGKSALIRRFTEGKFTQVGRKDVSLLSNSFLSPCNIYLTW